MRRIFLSILLLSSVVAFSQGRRLQLSPKALRNAQIRASILPYVDEAIFAHKEGLYSDVAGTQKVVDGSYVKYIKEWKHGNNVIWASDDWTRRSYISPQFGSAYDLTRPVYKEPAGDVSHIIMVNVLDTYLTAAIGTHASPNTMILVGRKRRGIQDETFTPTGALVIKENSANTQTIANNASSVTISGSSAFTEEQILFIEVTDNGASSKLLVNNVQMGSNATLTASNITEIGLGTSSHPYEFDFFAMFQIYGGLSTNRTALYAALTAAYPSATIINQPYAGGVSIAFSTDTWTVSSTFHTGYNGASLDASKDQIEWMQTTNTTDVHGWTNIDTQKPIYGATGLTLKRSDYPTYFPDRGTTSNNSVLCRVKRFNTNGEAWGDIPLRNLSAVIDNVVGTPAGSYAPTWSSLVINNATPSRIVVTYTGGSGTLNNTSSAAADWTVWVNGAYFATATSIGFPGGNVINVDFASSFGNGSSYAFPSSLQLRLTQGGNPLKDTNNKICESMISGMFKNITNNVVGAQVAPLNLSIFEDTAYPGWSNTSYDPHSGTGTVVANMTDNAGNATGVTLAITTIFNGIHTNAVGPTNATYPDPHMTRRGWELWTGGNATGVIKLSGFTPGAAVRIRMCHYDDTNSADAGTITIVGATTYNSGTISCGTTLQTTDQTLNADGSGFITITATATNTVFSVNSIIITKN